MLAEDTTTPPFNEGRHMTALAQKRRISHQAKNFDQQSGSMSYQQAWAAEIHLGNLADEIVCRRECYLQQSDCRPKRSLIIKLIDHALTLRGHNVPGLVGMSRMLAAMNECGIVWSDGLNEINKCRLVGLTAIKAFAISLAMTSSSKVHWELSKSWIRIHLSPGDMR